MASLENWRHGGIKIRRRALALRTAVALPVHQLRAGCFSDWVKNNYLFVLDDALNNVGILARDPVEMNNLLNASILDEDAN